MVDQRTINKILEYLSENEDLLYRTSIKSFVYHVKRTGSLFEAIPLKFGKTASSEMSINDEDGEIFNLAIELCKELFEKWEKFNTGD